MPKRVPPLSDIQVRNAKPKNKDYRLTDGDGLYLYCHTSGGKLWRMDYSFNGKRLTLALGSYPAVTLADARQRREDAKKLLANGVNPSEFKKAQKAAVISITANTFESIARKWHEEAKAEWSENYSGRLLTRLENDIFPAVGNRPITSIRTPEMEELLKRVAIRTLETAHRLKIACDMVYRYAIRKELAENNPVAALKGVLPPVKYKHMAAPTDPKDVAPLLRAIDDFNGGFTTKCALRLSPILFCRPGELRAAEWSEFDFEAEQWNIPASRMKMKEPHIVPLSKQAIAILKELQPLTGSGKYLFPSTRSPQRCMSDNTLNASFRRMGFEKDEITAHGFRAMARTILDEVLQQRVDFIEHQLAHAVKDPLGRAYNRTSHLPERRKMMQLWSDYLDGLKAGAKVIPLKRAEGQ